MRNLIYAALLHTARLLIAAHWWWRGAKLPEYRQRGGERRARIAYPAQAQDGIIVHAVSMGEVMAALPFIEQLKQTWPSLPITVTCTTHTASALIKQRLGDSVTHFYMPFDTPGAVRRFLLGLKPRLLVLMETELWPQLIEQAQQRGIRVIIANARLSEKSAKRYRHALALIKPTLCSVDLWLTQDAATRSRLLGLGVAPALVKVTGNLKMSTAISADQLHRSSQLKQLIQGRTIWLAASTHAGEEEQILSAHQRILAQRPDTLLVLVPRHPQRFDEVAHTVKQQGLLCQQQSKGEPCKPQTQVWLADSMGELMAWFCITPVVFMGGSFVPIGGHNPLEPALLGAGILSGPHVFNFQTVYDALRSEQAVQFIEDANSLAKAVSAWLSHPEHATEVGLRAQAWLKQQQGAAEKNQQAVAPLLHQFTPTHTKKAGHLLRRTHIVWDAATLGQTSSPQLWFDLANWQGQKAVVSQASGRGTAWFLRHTGSNAQELALVWRHYFRGGLMGRILGDRFICWPWTPSRSMQEFKLLQRMRAWQLPVPPPAAAKVSTQWFVQRSDIVMERVPHASDWVSVLKREPLKPAIWQRAGQCIADMHAHGVNHTDLNAHNLLLDASEQVWIIDFDKCDAQLMSLTDNGWEHQNLQRLKRSLLKEERLAKQQGLNWHALESDWVIFETAYRERFAELALTAP